MDYSRVFAIASAGMTAERTRVEVATMNLANASTVSSADAAYVPQQVVARAVPLAAGFASQVASGLGDAGLAPLVPQVTVESSGAAPRSRYEPGNPMADADGLVQQPGVDNATEMMTLMSAMRAYEANVAAASAARTLALKTLEIGGNG